MAPLPRMAIYGLVSTLGAAAVVGSALKTKPNFFAAAVTVGQSPGALMVLANFVLFNAICVGMLVKTVFFGTLRRIEYEHMFERLWIFITESLLALTIFRDEFSTTFAVMFGVLCFVKCFHWITADRVDYMDQVPHPGPSRLLRLRLLTIIFLLIWTDAFLFKYCLDDLLFHGVSAVLLFTSEYMILIASILGTGARYGINVTDQARAAGRPDAPQWEAKSMYLFYVDLAVDFVKLLTYLAFFLVILVSHGLPLHILRDVYMTLRSFISRCQDLVRYRRATRDMDVLYPNATHAELEAAGDATCIICREEMVASDAPAPAAAPGAEEGEGADASQTPPAAAPASPPAPSGSGDGPNETPKKLQCGHAFHFHCLRSWLERQQSCPTCRRDVLRPPTLDTRRADQQRRQQQVPPPAQPGAGVNPRPIWPDFGWAPPQPHAHAAVPHLPHAPAPAAPAPAPGAAPAPPGAGSGAAANPTANPTAAPTSAGGTASGDLPFISAQDRAEYERYFRFPGVQAAAAAPPGYPPFLHQQVPAGAITSIPGGRIWSGPIVPGRFTDRPLGAAPRVADRWPHQDTSNGVRSGRLAGAGRAGGGLGSNQRGDEAGAGDDLGSRIVGPEVGVGLGAGAASTRPLDGAYDVPTPVSPDEAHHGIVSARPSSSSLAHSGTVTPFTSNPPEIFSSLQKARTRAGVGAAVGDNAGARGADGADHTSSSGADADADVEAEDGGDDAQLQLSDADRRRVIAEAASRRFAPSPRLGAVPSASVSASASPQGGVDTAAATVAEEAPRLTAADKGKGRADLLDPNQPEGAMSVRLPTLTPAWPGAVLSTGAFALGSVGQGSGEVSNAHVDLDYGVDETRRELQRVQEVVSGLMRDLERLRGGVVPGAGVTGGSVEGDAAAGREGEGETGGA